MSQRVTRKSLETLCANVNEARIATWANTGKPFVAWEVEYCPTGWEVSNGDGKTYHAAGMTASECERFLQGAIAVARS